MDIRNVNRGQPIEAELLISLSAEEVASLRYMARCLVPSEINENYGQAEREIVVALVEQVYAATMREEFS